MGCIAVIRGNFAGQLNPQYPMFKTEVSPQAGGGGHGVMTHNVVLFRTSV